MEREQAVNLNVRGYALSASPLSHAEIPEIKMPTEATLNKIVAASMERMADFASHVEPNASYTAEDIAAVVLADPNSDTARFLAGLIAKSIELVATLEYAEAA